MAAIIQTPAINGTAPNGAGTGLDAVPKNTLNGTPLYNPNLVNGTQLNGGQNIEAIANGAIEPFKVLCGPLLNFKRMSSNASRRPIWHGSILLVTEPGGSDYPELSLSSAGTISANAAVERGVEGTATTDSRRIRPVRLFEDPQKLFLRYTFEILLQDSETEWRYTLPNTRHHTRPANGRSASWSFIVPAAEQSMRIMFHSCNGFSVGTDEAAWSGPALWNDVLRMHEKKPFHVMIGGGDQIYNDGVRVKGPLKAWTDIGNPKKRRDFPFQESLRADCDKYYFDNYVKWFSTAPFADANSRIPQVNIWDDHDIIDGFGSYTDHFMRCAVFRGIGGISFKYYCLFQQHIAPPVSTFTTESPQTMKSQGLGGAGPDPYQVKDSYVLQNDEEDPSFIFGPKPGPYVEERSRSLYMQLGARIAFLGVDARTERTRHQVNYPETYELLFKRLNAELTANPSLSHLIVLLGVPIAYPRLAWLESIFTSPIIGPIRFLSKRFGVAGGFFNQFDGQVDLLDDLDDHYTARQHKKERKNLILSLQALAKKYDVRVSILGGDVHLAALGRFYSTPKLNIPTEVDHRYMANIISSAITNKPPPKAVANLLARRNFIHRLDHNTDETLLSFFDKDPGANQITSNANHSTMPSRNYAIITETPTTSSLPPSDPAAVNGNAEQPQNFEKKSSVIPVGPGLFKRGKDGHGALHAGEAGAGSKHVVASGLNQGALPGGLDVAIRVEVDQHDPQGKTEGYGFSIPRLSKLNAVGA